MLRNCLVSSFLFITCQSWALGNLSVSTLSTPILQLGQLDRSINKNTSFRSIFYPLSLSNIFIYLRIIAWWCKKTTEFIQYVLTNWCLGSQAMSTFTFYWFTIISSWFRDKFFVNILKTWNPMVCLVRLNVKLRRWELNQTRFRNRNLKSPHFIYKSVSEHRSKNSVFVKFLQLKRTWITLEL